MTTAHLVDRIILLVVAVVPILLVLRWNTVGVVLSVFVVWGGLIVSGWVLDYLDPERDNAMLDAIWLSIGWLAGLMYGVLIYVLKRLYVYIARRRSLTRLKAES